MPENKNDMGDFFSQHQDIIDFVNEIYSIAVKSNPKHPYLHHFTKRKIAFWAFHAKKRYHTFDIYKKNGKTRTLAAPAPPLKFIQTCINVLLQNIFNPHEVVYGFVKGRNIIQNAHKHTNKNYVLNLDLQDFFGTIHFRRIKTVLQLPPFSYSDQLAFLIANLCCENGCLPQGAPTSPLLSNIVCQKLDRQLFRFAKEHKVRYTRYADDITFSSRKSVFDDNFMEKIIEIITQNHFTINPQKTRLQSYSQRQMVTGLVVNEKVNVSQSYIKTLRANLHNWATEGYEKAEKMFREKSATQAALKDALKGKLEFLGLVRGKEDKIYLKYKNVFEKLIEPISEKSNSDEYKQQVEKSEQTNDFLFFNPKNISNFFTIFHRSKGMKYLTHDYDEGAFDYDNILKIAEDDFNSKTKEYPIAPTLYEKIRHFAFEKSPKWSSENIELGWQVQTLKDWCKENKGKHPIENNYWREEMIDKFKNAIEIRKPNLRTIFEDIISKKLRPEKHFKITLLELEKASFYTDVDQFRNGIRYIFNAINEHSKKRDVEIAFLRTFMPDGQMRKTIKIIDIGSVMDIEANRDEFKGDLNSATDNLKGLCEWFIEAKFSNGFFSMCILGNLEQQNKAEAIEEKGILGVTHLLHFY